MDKRTTEVKLNCVFRFVFEQMWLLYLYQKFTPTLWFYLNESNYLLVVDYFSRFPEIQQMSITTSRSVVNALNTMFSPFGIPETILSGSQYNSSEFTKFAEADDFSHVTSSPLFAQINGQVERIVQTVKKAGEVYQPSLSTAFLLMHPICMVCSFTRRTTEGKTIVCQDPYTKESTNPRVEEFRDKNHIYKQQQKHNFDLLSSIPDDTNIWITSGDQPVPCQNTSILHHRNTIRTSKMKPSTF